LTTPPGRQLTQNNYHIPGNKNQKRYLLLEGGQDDLIDELEQLKGGDAAASRGDRRR
jgi:hypothetical protein